MTHPNHSQGRLGAVSALLVALVAVPAAVLVVPNTMTYVVPQALAELGAGPGQVGALVRSAGLALPALLLAVPGAAVAARRLPPWTVLLAGLFCVLAGELGAMAVGSVPLIGAVRALQGAGAGAILPATLILAWARRDRLPLALWAGSFIAALIVTMPLALAAVPTGAGQWRPVLSPQPLLVGAALAVAALTVSVRGRAVPLPLLRAPERTQLLLPLVPAAGFAFLAVAATGDAWAPGVKLIVAGLGLVALTGLAIIGSRDASTGSPLGVAIVMVTVGLLTLPVTAPLAGLAATHHNPGGLPAAPFLAGGAAALGGALSTVRLGAERARSAIVTGHGLAIISILVLLMVDPGANGFLLALPMVLLGVGAGLALAASLRDVRLGSALFGLSLCFPAVLTGHLVSGSLQVAKVESAVQAGGGQVEVVYALTAAFRVWLIVAGVLTVLLAGAVMIAGRATRSVREEDARMPVEAG
ncbi:MAG: hypothetical protein ABIS86_13435 [Streptosporangiaceae bacterium]